MAPEEGPARERETGSSADLAGKRRPLARSSVDGLAQELGAGERIEEADIVVASPGDRSWRIDFQALDQLELRDIAALRTRVTVTAGQVVIFGLQELDAVGTAWNATDRACELQMIEGCMHAGLGVPAHREHDLAVRWRDAMCFHMGADEYEAFTLARCQAYHGATP